MVVGIESAAVVAVLVVVLVWRRDSMRVRVMPVMPLFAAVYHWRAWAAVLSRVGPVAFSGVIPPGIGKGELLGGIDRVGKIGKGEIAENGIAAGGQVRKADGELAFVEGVIAADGEVGVGILGGGAEEFHRGADVEEFMGEIANGGNAKLQGGGESHFF